MKSQNGEEKKSFSNTNVYTFGRVFHVHSAKSTLFDNIEAITTYTNSSACESAWVQLGNVVENNPTSRTRENVNINNNLVLNCDVTNDVIVE